MIRERFHQFGLWVIDNPNFNGISIADLVDTELMSITEAVDMLNELYDENEKLVEENEQLHYQIIELQDKLGMSEKVIE